MCGSNDFDTLSTVFGSYPGNTCYFMFQTKMWGLVCISPLFFKDKYVVFFFFLRQIYYVFLKHKYIVFFFKHKYIFFLIKIHLRLPLLFFLYKTCC